MFKKFENRQKQGKQWTEARSIKMRIVILPLLATRKIPRSSEINITSHNWIHLLQLIYQVRGNFLVLDLFFAKFWFAITWYNVLHFSFCLQKQSFVRKMKRPIILESFESTFPASLGNRNIEEPQK